MGPGPEEETPQSCLEGQGQLPGGAGDGGSCPPQLGPRPAPFWFLLFVTSFFLVIEIKYTPRKLGKTNSDARRFPCSLTTMMIFLAFLEETLFAKRDFILACRSLPSPSARFQAPTSREEGPEGTFWVGRFPWWPIAHSEHLWGILYLLRPASGQHERLTLSFQHWGCPGSLGAAEGPRVPRKLRTASPLGARRPPPSPLLPSLSAPCRGRPLSGVTLRLQAVVGWGP